MSSTYLTSKDLSRIQSVLAEARPSDPNWSPDRETVSAKLLIRTATRGRKSLTSLRLALAAHVRRRAIMEEALDRWNNEGGRDVRRAAQPAFRGRIAPTLMPSEPFSLMKATGGDPT